MFECGGWIRHKSQGRKPLRLKSKPISNWWLVRIYFESLLHRVWLASDAH